MTDIVERLAAEFDASPEFVGEILRRRNLLALSQEAPDIDAFRAATGGDWKYVAYSLGTNQRAKRSLDQMFALGSPDRIGRALDVGCGYGGFMRAFVSRGFEANGIEIDGNLAALAELNLGSSKLQGKVYVGDLFSGEFKLGSFDLITVNDVIEHLPDPFGAFNLLARMLSPGGMLGIYAPNGRSIFYATADPHNRVFASSILPGPLASIYAQAMLQVAGYGLGEYLGLDEFSDLCKRNELGFCYRPHDGGERPVDAMKYLDGFIAAFREAEFQSKVTPLVARLVETAIWQYVGEYSLAASRAAAGKNYSGFNDCYLSRAWTIVCKKGSAK